jgi:hypothetical protein
MIFVKLRQDDSLLPDKDVDFKVVDGEECGSVDPADPSTVKTDKKGRAEATFTAVAGRENCTATVQVSAEGVSRNVYIRVRPAALGSVRIDGVSAVALILIASFAIDRMVRGLLFVLAFWRPWAASFPDPDEPTTTPALKKRGRIAYLGFAVVLSTIVLAWYGGVRVFSAMGFIGIPTLLDTVVTGLILVGGAERTDAILKSLSGGGGSEAAAAPATPLQITGTLVLTGERDGPPRPPLLRSA